MNILGLYQDRMLLIVGDQISQIYFERTGSSRAPSGLFYIRSIRIGYLRGDLFAIG